MKKVNKILLSFAMISILGVSFLFVGCNSKVQEEYILAVRSANIAAGTVYGSGHYTEDEEVVICAVPKEGYEFDHWSDDLSLRYSSVRTVVVSQDIEITAYFKEKTKYAVVESVQIRLSSGNSSEWTLNAGESITCSRWVVQLNNDTTYGDSGNSQTLLFKNGGFSEFSTLNGCRNSFTANNGVYYVNNKLHPYRLLHNICFRLSGLLLD